ncbi:hypothetical protein ULMS_26570 [Patiriisocius marinistellae]|uniref:Uncharacterized protein n=1 Tax=Patiriisocius marinistellae TaxID=2494560 RepID=A0A5J4G2R1_9FLAO|nr:hypothetical protein [Patiriisocius marinistellae]GEQ87149.1 hypothetical protein ULMS_26570 [Patiriisocius marinistellae]
MITIAFVGIVVSDIFMLHYETTLYSNLYMLIKMLVYIIIIVGTLKKLFVVEVPAYLKVFSVLLFGLSMLLIHFMISYLDISQIDNSTVWLFYFIALIMLVGVFVTGYYSHVYGSRKAYCISVSMLSFVISDCAAFVAYYLNIEYFYYIERSMYLYGLFYLVHYVNKSIKEEDISLIREW